MILFNLRITEEIDAHIERFVKCGLYPNRSECGRELLKKGIEKEFEHISLSDTFKRIYNNRHLINRKIEKLIDEWEREDNEK